MLSGRGDSVARRDAATQAPRLDFGTFDSKPQLSGPLPNLDSSATSDREVLLRDPGPCQTIARRTRPSTIRWRLPAPTRLRAWQGEGPRSLPPPDFASTTGRDVPRNSRLQGQAPARSRDRWRGPVPGSGGPPQGFAP